MITKEKFFEILDYIQETNKFEESLRQVLESSKRSTDFLDPAMFTDCRMIDYLLYLLEDEFNDTVYNWIYYWIYELDYGRDWSWDSFVDKNGVAIKLQTKEDLYDFLVQNMD